jgi:hypothetical protein
MVGFTTRSKEEPVYRLLLSGMRDEALERETRMVVWLFLTTIDGPWKEDIWARESCRRECEKRGKPEIFSRAEAFILGDPRITEQQRARL